MINYEEVLLNLVKPLCSNDVTVKLMDSIKEDELLLFVYANNDDIGRLIGKKGIVASAIRNMMQIATRQENKKLIIKFETI